MEAFVEFDLKIFKKNINIITEKCKGIKYIFPVKCCTNPKILEILADFSFGFDISNNNEYKKIKKYLNGQFVSVSGPLSYQLIDQRYNNLHIVANNLDIYRYCHGLRINFNYNDNFEKSRFGVNFGECKPNVLESLKYIHFHNSDKKTKQKCENIFLEIEKIVMSCPKLEYINIGGHLEDLTIDQGIVFLNRVREIVPKKIIIIAELGDFLFKDCGTLYCEVIESKKIKEKQIVTLNFSKMANQRWVYPRYQSTIQSALIETEFYGCSCCETDFFLTTKSQMLKKGERLIFSNISPYSYEWNTEFNGVKRMEFKFLYNRLNKQSRV